MNKPFSNQELLKELDKRLPDFTLNELASLSELVMTSMPSYYKKKALGEIEEISPQFHDSVQKTVRQLEQEKINKQIKEISKCLEKK